MRHTALLPEAPRRHRVFGGLSERQEHVFTWVAVVVVLLFLTAWVGALVEVRQEMQAAGGAGASAPNGAVTVRPTRQITTAVFESGAPTTAYINDAMLSFLTPLRGESGSLRFTTRTPGDEIVRGAPGEADAVLTNGNAREVSGEFTAPAQPGVYKMAVQIDRATRQLDDFSVITLVPRAEKRGGKIGLYYLGNWPFEGGGTPKTPAYAPPSGFIEVTRENQGTHVSEHFRLRDFLTKDQPNVWPKYLLLNPKLIDKLELAIQDLEARGVKIEHVQVMSGFRTPRYNHSGGNVAGRANLSRHMYGDGADVFVDNDRNGTMDDINRDGRVDTRDAACFGEAVERVEKQHPALVGGVGVYSACCGHGPFTHVDVRGYRARWRGEGNG
jgi:hypothetical protein